MDLEKIKVGGTGGFYLLVLTMLFNMQTSLNDISKVVQKNSSRLDVIEYRLNAEGNYVRQSAK